MGAAVGGLWSRNAASTGGALGGLAGATVAELKSGADGLFASEEDGDGEGGDGEGDESGAADAAA
ncbi:hypothetical protein C464_08260 [Halorubrum coriense DSM 10284]|uniref:Glycine zipper domain-containing protein n=1 Tax=Halorubrum coriense DSM 10284 TaxID=1227466 RepID=M0EJF8_9EURY|nr:hypothetical protein C464_08260 [Halorubrum coriense DSM 10284]